MRGGNQSKVLDALFYGCVQVETEIAFEGLSPDDPTPGLNQMRLEQFVSNPLTGQVMDTRSFYTSPALLAVVFVECPQGRASVVVRKPLQVP
jgi:hypothetical protein